MRKARKFFTGLLCAAMVFSSVLPVHAEKERIIVAHCTQCLTGALTSHQKTTSVSDHKDCIHGHEGAVDLVDVYTVTTVLTCNNCSYKETTIDEKVVIKRCLFFDP